MAPNFWSKFSRKKRGKQDSPASIKVNASASPEPRPPETTPATTPDLAPSPRSVSLRQPTPVSPPQTDIRQRLWSRAYDDLRTHEPELVEAYETLFCEGESSTTDAASRKNIIEQMGVEERRSQMARLVDAGLENTKNEAAVKEKIKGGMDVITSVKKLIDAAVSSVPQAAPAWAAVGLVLQILENPVSEATANRDGMAYVISRMNWYWELSALLLENRGERFTGLRDELEEHVVGLYEKLFSYQMRSVYSYSRNRAVVVLRDMVKLDDWEGTLKSIRDAENAVQHDSAEYNTEKIKSHLENIAESAKALKATLLSGIREALHHQTEEQRKMRREDKDEQCLKDLRLTDPRDDKQRIEDTKGGLFRGASNWILDHRDFHRWQDCDDARLLWIKGDPGKGKTMLLITIVDELERQLNESAQQEPTVLSYFFCQGTNKDLNNATAVLRGLVYLLGVKYPQLVSHLRGRYDHAGLKLFEDINSFVALSKVLESMICDKGLTRAYLVVDALDECVADRKRLLKLIAHHAAASPRVKWIVSSRNKDDIEQHLETDHSGMKLGLEITQNAEQVSRAVNAYIDFKISNLRVDDERKKRVRNIMREKANGTFLWVALVAKELEKARSWRVLQVVEHVPASLQDLYDLMMAQIRQPEGEDWEFCQLVLAAVTLAYRPLYLAELGILSGLPPEISANTDYTREIVALCGSFLTVKDDFVYVIHQSVKDYLSGKASGTIFPNGPGQVHHAIFSRSVQALLSLPLRRNIYGLPRFGMPADEVKTPNPDPLAGLHYACVHWANHFCDIYRSDNHSQEGNHQDAEAICHFIKNYFLYWMEAVALLRSMSDGVAAIRRLDSLLKSSKSQLLDLVKDSLRFALHNKSAIENAPLQAYASALLFSPAYCLMRRMFTKEEEKLGWIRLKPIVEVSWSACTQTLEGHGGSVNSVAFSTDGKHIASGSSDNTIKVWEAATVGWLVGIFNAIERGVRLRASRRALGRVRDYLPKT